jgi:hypothetical protein
MVTLSNTYNLQIKQFIDANLQSFNIVESKTHGPFFYTEFMDELIKIVVQGDIGGFEILIFIEDEKYSLWQYDRSVNNAMKTTEKNIIYQLNVLKSFLSDGI